MKVKVKSERCKECGLCEPNCPQKAITFSEGFNVFGYHPVEIDQDNCIACGICYTMCPDGVYEVIGN